MHVKVYGLFNNKKWVLFNSLCVSLNINVLHTKAYNSLLALGIFCCTIDGITAAGRKNKRGSDVTSDEDIVDESNNFRLTGDTFKENSIHKSCHPSQSHSLEAARCTDGMSSQGTKTANKYSILMEKI
uniref:Uncharacterized protein n=1 Tax=Strongyloides venezuelensis TaxID=75913 RepID=A0A0K0EWF2_STRVS